MNLAALGRRRQIDAAAVQATSSLKVTVFVLHGEPPHTEEERGGERAGTRLAGGSLHGRAEWSR